MPRSQNVLLASLTVADRAASPVTTETLRYAFGRYTSQPGDSPANTTWLPLIREQIRITQEIGTNDRPLGALEIGTIEIDNSPPHPGRPRPVDEKLWSGDGAGWPLVIETVAPGAAYSTATAVATLIQEVPELTRSSVRVRVRDRMGDLDTPVLTARYAGTGGVEGDADLEDRAKERCWGECYDIRPTYLGLSTGGYPWYSVNGGNAIEDVTAVYDGRQDLGTEAAGYPLSSSAGSRWKADRSNGTIEVYTKPEYDLTADVLGDKRGGTYRDTPSEIIQEIVVEHLALATSGELDSTAWTARTTARGWSAGLYVAADSTMTAREAVERMCRADRYWVAWTAAGELTTGALGAPTGTASATWHLGTHHGGLEPTGRPTMPAHEVSVGYRRAYNFGAQTAALADDTDIQFAEAEYRYTTTATVDSDAVLARCPIAETLTFNTDLADEANAATLRGEIETDAADVRREYTLSLFLDAADLPALGAIVEVHDDLPGFTSGRKVRVTSIDFGPMLSGVAEITVRD